MNPNHLERVQDNDTVRTGGADLIRHHRLLDHCIFGAVPLSLRIPTQVVWVLCSETDRCSGYSGPRLSLFGIAVAIKLLFRGTRPVPWMATAPLVIPAPPIQVAERWLPYFRYAVEYVAQLVVFGMGTYLIQGARYNYSPVWLTPLG